MTFTAGSEDAGIRLDAFLAERISGWSRSRLQRVIDAGDVLVDQRASKSSYKLKEGDEVDVDLTEPPTAQFEPENIPLDIVYEDDFLAVINKPAGMIVHPGAGITSGTLANAIAWHFNLQNSVPKPARSKAESFQYPAASNGDASSEHRVGIVHRLDKGTSGLILVAKDSETQEALGDQFRNRTVHKSYIALVHGSPRESSGIIDRRIARDRWHRTKMTDAANGRNALTHWKVRQRFEKFTLLDVDIKTGRTHQIRVHLASINHPVVGDETYNEGRDNTIADVALNQAVGRLGRQFLHAGRLAFDNPRTGERMLFTAGLPDELNEILGLL